MVEPPYYIVYCGVTALCQKLVVKFIEGLGIQSSGRFSADLSDFQACNAVIHYMSLIL
jgi:hypothetical protein